MLITHEHTLDDISVLQQKEIFPCAVNLRSLMVLYMSGVFDLVGDMFYPDVEHAVVVHWCDIFIVQSGSEFLKLLVYFYACPCVGCGIYFLFLCQGGGIPVGEPFALGYFFAEDVSIDFLQAHVLNTDILHSFLQFYIFSETEIAAFA